jgi:hypothetical protein
MSGEQAVIKLFAVQFSPVCLLSVFITFQGSIIAGVPRNPYCLRPGQSVCCSESLTFGLRTTVQCFLATQDLNMSWL